jgi:predicted O-methyltransferase YrrM
MESKFFASEAIIRYIEGVSAPEHPLLAELRRETDAHPEHQMQITALQGQFLQLLVLATGARKTLEIGVFTGYSSLAVALALPDDGRVTALDISEEYTSVARRYWKKAGVEKKIDLRIAPALESLDRLTEEGAMFDFAFIDADKTGYPEYFEKTLALMKRGGLIAVDNTLRDGKVIDLANREIDTIAIRGFNASRRNDERVISSLLPIADGLTLAVKR